MSEIRDRKVYDFKSVGTFDVEKQTVEEAVPVLPIGLKTPLSIGNRHGLWQMHTDAHRQIADNLRNLVLTNHGERLGNYFFGANLGALVFELQKDNAIAQAMSQVKSAVKKWMPFVALRGFAPEIDHYDNKEVAKISIVITYVVPKIDNNPKAIRVVLYVGG